MVTRVKAHLNLARAKPFWVNSKRYDWYYLLSLSLGLIYSLPLFRHAFNNSALPLAIANDTLYYLTKIQSWKYSFGLPLNPYHENSFETVSNYTFVAESFLAIIARLTEIDVNFIYALVTFLSFNINFFLVMRLSNLLGLKPSLGLIAFLLSYIVLVPYAPYRPISPQINLILYLLICIALVSFFASSLSPKHLVVLGLLQFLSWFIYPYYALLTSLLAFLFIVARSQRSFRLASVRLLTLVLIPSVPWLIVGYLSSPDFSRQTALRTSLVESNHYPGAFTILLGSLILVLLVLVARLLNTTITLSRFLVFQGLSILLVSNSQVVTGKSIQFESHYILLFWLNSTLLLLALTQDVFKSRFRNMLFLLIFALVIRSVYSYYYDVSRQETVQVSIEERNLWKFILNNTDLTEIISAPLDVSENIVYVTGRKVLATPLSRLYIMSDEELTQRVLLNHYPGELSQPIPEQVYVSIFGLKFRDALSKNARASSFLESARNHSRQITLDEARAIKLLVNGYAKLDFANGLDRFEIDWLVRPTPQLSEFESLSSNCRITLTRVDKWEICRW